MSAPDDGQESGFSEPGAGDDGEALDLSDDSPAASGSPSLVLNVGCGYPLRQRLHPYFQGDNWREIRLDIDPGVKPDICCSITQMTPVATASVDAVWSSHNLEHLHRHEVPLALGEFLRVLRPGGLLLLTLPDLQRVAELIARDALEEPAYVSPSGPITPLDMVFGHSASIAHGHHYMAHKTGFTGKSLVRALSEAGFIDIQLRRATFDLWSRAHTPAA